MGVCKWCKGTGREDMMRMKYAIVYYEPVKRVGELRKNQGNLPRRKKELALSEDRNALVEFMQKNGLSNRDYEIVER